MKQLTIPLWMIAGGVGDDFTAACCYLVAFGLTLQSLITTIDKMRRIKP